MSFISTNLRYLGTYVVICLGANFKVRANSLATSARIQAVTVGKRFYSIDPWSHLALCQIVFRLCVRS